MSVSEVRFPVDEGIELGAWLYLPNSDAQRSPAITMAHGYAGVKEHGITRFAEAFTDAGFVVLLHDHRTFGISGGEPRQDVDPWRQVADWRRAISYLESRPEVDPKRIGLWGTSYAGGHALVLGATDRRTSRQKASRRWRQRSTKTSAHSCAANHRGARQSSAQTALSRPRIGQRTPSTSTSNRSVTA
jgi:dipeptidyl aminopeptidase/acylaminoacyl peptidase